MRDLLLYIIIVGLVTSGIAGVLVYSTIGMPFRVFWQWIFSTHMKFMQELSYCCLCVGFWASLIAQDFVLPQFELQIEILISFACAFICWGLNALVQYYLWRGAIVKAAFECEFKE